MNTEKARLRTMSQALDKLALRDERIRVLEEAMTNLLDECKLYGARQPLCETNILVLARRAAEALGKENT